MDSTIVYIIVFVVTLVASGIGMWIRKLYLKKYMERGLGRKVEDRELTDISEWMKAIPDDQPKHPPKPHG